MNNPSDIGDGIDGAQNVGGMGYGDQFRARTHQSLQIREIDRKALRVDRPGLEDDAPLLEDMPRPDIRLMVENGDDHLITGVELRRHGGGEQAHQRRSRRPQDDLLWSRGIQKTGEAGTRSREPFGGSHRMNIGCAGLHTGCQQILRDAFGDVPQYQRAAGIVEIGKAVIQSRETCADGGKIERHGSSFRLRGNQSVTGSG